MLRHGNAPPIEQFDDAAQFCRLLLLQDFRAAVAIARPRLFLDESRGVTGVDFWYLQEVGFTPVRRAAATIHCSGRAAKCRSAQLQPETAEIDLSMSFKLGWFADLYGKAKTKFWAPSPSVRLKYTIAASGLVTIEVSASHVPSHSVYVDWARKLDYRIESGAWEFFHEFLTLGFCVTAPTFEVYMTKETCTVRENPQGL